MSAGWLPVSRRRLRAAHYRRRLAPGERLCRVAAEIDLAAMARFTSGDGLGVGELRASLTFLAHRWRWSRSAVQRFLNDLADEGLLERRADDPTILRVLRYGEDFAADTAGDTAGDTADAAPRKDFEGDAVRRSVRRASLREKGSKEREITISLSATSSPRFEFFSACSRAFDDGLPDRLLEVARELLGLRGMSVDDAEWVLDRVDEALELDCAATEDGPARTAAGVLWDLRRKGLAFNRPRFAKWYTAAVRAPGFRDDDAHVDAAMEELFGGYYSAPRGTRR